MIDFKQIEVYAAKNKDKKVLLKSSSGGVFYSIAKKVLDDEGIVCGATYNENGKVFHTIIDSIDDLDSILGSKYVRSDLGDIFKKIKVALSENKKVLFCGTPCQVGALFYFLGKKEYDNLTTIDFICHGTPEPKYWDMFLKQNSISHVDSLNFRFKKPSWENYSLKINNKIFKKINPYMYYFLNNYTLLESCYDCKFKGFNRHSDITLCDLWGNNYYYTGLKNKYGVSGVILNSEKARHIFQSLKGEYFFTNCNLSLITERNSSYFESSKKPNDYNDVVSNINLSDEFKQKNNLTVRTKAKQIISKTINFIFSFEKSVDWNEHINLTKNSNNYQIGIISDFGYHNYGNKLQNFALTQILKSKGYNPVNIIYKPNYLNTFKGHIYKLLKIKPLEKKRMKQIKKVSRLYESNSYFRYTAKNKEKLNSLQMVIFGSDQIWNCSYHSDRLFALGNFGIQNENFIKVSYAASIGSEDIPIQYKHLFFTSLQSFKYISCREQSGADAINKLGFNAVATLDPTLLFSGDEWREYYKQYSKLKLSNKKYVLLYFLVNMKEKENVKLKYKNSKYEVVDILDKNSKHYLSHQFDFLNYIDNAQHIYTDSFHACLFSILFKKKISVYSRKQNISEDNMLARITNLFAMFGQKIDLEIKNEFNSNDFNFDNLLKLKEQSINYLNDALISLPKAKP